MVTMMRAKKTKKSPLTFNISQHPDIVGRDKVDGDTLTSKSSSTTDTMDVVLPVGGQVIVDDEGNLLDVNATSEKICRNQNAR